MSPPPNRIEIPISGGDVLSPDPHHSISGGDTRIVRMVPVGDNKHLPCIWKSKYLVNDLDANGQSLRGHECLLLLSRNPLTTLRAIVDYRDDWQSFPTTVVEW